MVAEKKEPGTNLKLAIKTGQFLEALEKAKLQRYQDNNACEVLSYEVSTCSSTQRKEIEKSFNLKEVLGNYCQPHLSPPMPTPKSDHFMKGAEIISWQEQNGYIWYALLPGTNRTKTEKKS